MSFTVKMYRRNPWKEETPAYENYEATFQEKHAAEIYAEALQTSVSAFRINIVDETGKIVSGHYVRNHFSTYGGRKGCRGREDGCNGCQGRIAEPIWWEWVKATGAEAQPQLMPV